MRCAVLPALVAEFEGKSGASRGRRGNHRARRGACRWPAVVRAGCARGGSNREPYEPTLVIAKLEQDSLTQRTVVLPEADAPPAAEAAASRPDAPENSRRRRRQRRPTTPGSDDPLPMREGGDSSLQEIYQKEVQSHLEVIRAYLRHAWLAVGTHVVTEDLYRACHTLRGASRTADIRHSVRLAEPLHRWLRRMFDHDSCFDEAGLAVLADCVVGFEDILTAVHEDRPAASPTWSA